MSLTKITENIRDRKHTRGGRRRKRAESQMSTPVFSIHPEGYDPKAPDAKKSTSKADK